MPEVERRRITMPLPYSPSSPLNFIINSTTHDSAPNFTFPATDDDFNCRLSGDASPVLMSPRNPMSPFRSSPWRSAGSHHGDGIEKESRIDGFIGSLFREEGHLYSLASSGDLLYTGSDSKNIHVWKNLTEFTAFKCNSGFVKAIIVSGDRIFTGHQDGKVRVWKKSKGNSTNHKLVGTFPTFFDILKSSMRRQNYVAVKRNCSAIWIRHYDAISCLSIDEEQGLLYSGSWDRTFKVWNTSNSKCYESVKAHDDAVNAIVATRSGTIFTGSADGSIKVWKREYIGKSTKHSYVETLLSQQCAVTALAVPKTGSFVYSGLSNGSINFWEWEKQLTHGGVLTRHKLAVLCLAVAGKLLVSGSADKTICVWKREGSVHGCLSVLTGHTGPVKCLAVERDEGRRSGEMRWVVYSGSLDKSVRVWSVSEKSSEMMVQSGNGKYSNI